MNEAIKNNSSNKYMKEDEAKKKEDKKCKNKTLHCIRYDKC